MEEMLKGLTICSVTSKQFNVEFECSYDVSAWSVQHNPMQKCRITWGWGVGGQSHLVLQCRGAQCTAMGGVGWEEKVDRSNNERRLSLSEDSG